MTMRRTAFAIIEFTWFLTYATCVSLVEPGSSGITLGKPLIAVTDDQDVKRIQKNVRRGNRKAIKAVKSTLIQNSPLSDNHFARVLKDTETKENNFQGNDADNKGYVDASPEVDVLTPSALEENVYGELENQEAKNYGFHVEKDDSGGDILLGPITLENKEIKLENASLSQKLTSSEKQNLHKNVRPVKEQLLKDPLAKVSYLFSQEASRHNSSGKAPYKITSATNKIDNSANKKTSATNKIDNSADNGQNFTKNHNWGKIPASNSTFVGKMAVSSSLPNINTGTTLIKRERNISNDKLTENNQKAFNNTQLSEGRLDNSMQGSANAQLPELIENVIERLGDEGSRFVSMQLAKHPTVKNIWANAIALALLKQSDKISRLNFGRASNNSLKVLPKVDSTKVKSTDTLLQTNVNGEPIRKPGDGFSYSSHGANHMEEPAHTLGIINKTFTFTVMNTSKVAKELNSSTPASSSKLDVAGQKVQDSAKPGTQNEIAKKPIYQPGHIVISHSFNLSHRPLLEFDKVERLKGQNSTEASKEQVLDKGQLLTPYVNGLVSNVNNTIPLQENMEEKQRMGGKQLQTSSGSKTVAYEGSNEQVGENGKEEAAEDQKVNDETILGSMTNNVPSQEYLNQEIDGRFLFNNITKLDPDEAKYLQLNMMGDSMVNRQFSVSAASPYNGMQEEDAKEASYLEHQINDVGHIVGQVLPKPQTTVSDLDTGKANYVTGQLLDNRLGQAEVAESFARDNSLIKEEEKQNSKIMASVQQADVQHQTNPVFVSPEGRNGNMETISESTSSPFERLQSDKYETQVESNLEDQMLLSPKTVSDISAVDLAPMRSLVNFDRLTGTNKPSSSFSYDLHNDGNNQKEPTNEGDEAEFMTPYAMNALPDHLAQLKKKEKIAKTYSSKHKERKYRRKANLKQSPSFLRKLTPPRKLPLRDPLAVKPTKSRSQPGTRDSEISPTSVIFGLTANEMKEIEKHLAHGSNRAEAETSGSLQELSPETVAYYEVKPNDEEHKKKERSLLKFMDKPLKVKRLKTERKQLSQNRIASKAIQERKNVTPSRKGKVSHNLSSVQKRKKAKDNSNVRRDLESWEGHTDVLNSDLEQLRDLSPKVQEDISKVILKDYDGDQKNVKGLESFPFEEQDPSNAFERSFKNKKQSAGKGDNKGYKYTQRRLDVKRSPEKMGNEISKKEFQKKGTLSHGSKLSEATMAEPIVMKENKLLNGDVVSLDDVGHLDAQGLILETLRKESEGDLNYVNSVQVDDVSRIKNMFQKVGVEIGVKRHTGAHRKKPNKAFHSRKRILPEKRDLGEFSTEFNDGTFRSPEFEKQLSRALIQERQHDLTYLGAVQAMDDPVLNKMMDNPEEPISSRTILQNQFKSAFPKDDSSDDVSLEKSQEKLREFIHSSSRQDEEADAMKQRTADSIKDSVFRDLTPEGKVLNSDYKELTNFGTDDQNQLASVLRSVTRGDQNDLKELEKIDSADEKEVESLFRPMAGTFKRSIDEKPGIAREGAIETIADLPDHGSKEKNIVNNIASDFSKNDSNLMWSAWSKCSKTCGNGSMKTRSRYCIEKSSSDSFVKCPGWNHQMVPCDVPKNCPINGGFTKWTEWSACSETCGPKAVRMRMRLCTNPPPAYGGKDCSGWRFEVEYCRSQECPHTSATAASKTTKVLPGLRKSKTNKRIIFKTLSATPLIEGMASKQQSAPTKTSVNEGTPSRYSGLASVEQDMGDVQSLLNMQQTTPSFSNMLGFKEFMGPPHGSAFLPGSLRPNMLPGMRSMPRGPQETYENGGNTIHLQVSNENVGFTPWSEWTSCSASCGRGIRTRTRSCLSSYNAMGVDRLCLGPTVQTRRCRIQRCPVDGQFTPWSDWSECSKTCGSDSYRKRERTCTNPPPRYGGEDCEGRHAQRQHCLKSPCLPKLDLYNISKVFYQVVNSRKVKPTTNSTDGFTEWGPWSPCSKTCGSNVLRVRKRSCFNSSSQSCTGSTSEVKPCFLPKCPDDLALSEDLGINGKSSHNISVKNEFDWSPWSECSKTCGSGSYRKREKTCSFSLTENDGKLCIGSNIEKMPCNVPLCPEQAAGRPNNTLIKALSDTLDTLNEPVSIAASSNPQPSQPPFTSSNSSAVNSSSDSGYSDWSAWSKCSATCSPKAVMSRERTCKVKTGCQGLYKQTKPCQLVKCPVDGGLTGWTAWSACSKTCNTNAVSTRQRYCTNPPPQGNGKDCVGQRMQARPCASQKCPVDGGLSEWSKWSVCRHCGKSKRKRTRKCNNPPPANGGKPCAGPLVQELKCPRKHCKSTLGFGPWSSFSRCSHSCGGGVKKRRRRCRKPSHGCHGPRVQRKRCNEHSCPDENFLIRKDPVEMCGYHPCKVAKCLTTPTTMCVSDSECKPVFFNTNGKIIESCKGDAVVLSVPPEQVCHFNPCEKSACFTNEAERCVVSYKCKPIFFGADGERAYCRGILTVPATTICGFDPCFEKACKVDLTAHCVADAQCKPTFITNTERILDECVEDDDEDDSKDDSKDDSDNDDIPDVEDVSEKENYDDEGEDNKDDVHEDHDNDDDDESYDDDDSDNDGDDEKISHVHRSKKHKLHKSSHEDEEDDVDDEDAVSKQDVPRLMKDRSHDNKDNKTDENRAAHLRDESFHKGMVNGMASEISFVSKHGPAKFYWIKPGNKGSKNKTELLLIEANGSRKSSVLSAPRKVKLKPSQKLRQS